MSNEFTSSSESWSRFSNRCSSVPPLVCCIQVARIAEARDTDELGVSDVSRCSSCAAACSTLGPERNVTIGTFTPKSTAIRFFNSTAIKESSPRLLSGCCMSSLDADSPSTRATSSVR